MIFLTQKEKTANKTYVCDVCNKHIHEGEMYIYKTFKNHEGSFRKKRIHLRCHIRNIGIIEKIKNYFLE